MRLDLIRAGMVLAATVAVGCSAAPGAPVQGPASASPSVPIAVASPSPASTREASRGPAGSVGPSASSEPVVRNTSGTTDATATVAGMSFSATAAGRGTCTSRPDQLLVGGVTALDLGTLGPGVLRAQWPLPPSGIAATTIEAFIDAADLADGSFQPFWSGPARVTAAAPDGASGTLAFGPLPIEPDPALKLGQAAPSDSVSWPVTLEGTISWTCAPWPSPISSGAPPHTARP